MNNQEKNCNKPRRGNIDWQAIVSAFEPTIEDMMSNQSYFGMPPEAVYLWGSLRDENGEIYSPLRRIPAGLPTDVRDTRRRLFLIASPGHHDGMYVRPVSRETAINEGFSKTLEGEVVHWRSHPSQPIPFHMTWTPKTCSWQENDIVDIRGNDQFGFAILTSEKCDVRFTYDVNGEVKSAREGSWPEDIRLAAFGEEWEFLLDAKGRMLGLGSLNPQVDGRWRRVGDTREPEAFMAWCEVAPSHGHRRANRLPLLGERIGGDIKKY